MRYELDVKAFISLTIEADSEAEAKAEAQRFVEALEPGNGFADGWNDVQRQNGGPTIEEAGDFYVDSIDREEA